MGDNPPGPSVRQGGGWGEPIGQLVEALFTVLPVWAAVPLLVALVVGAYWLWSRWEHRQMLRRIEERKRQPPAAP